MGFAWSRQEVGRTEVRAEELLVVAARRETAEAGLAVLDEGGNAVDAAVAMGFVAATCEPTEASVAGSGFLLLHDPARDAARSVEFPPRAPLAARPDMFEPAEGPGEERLLGVGSVAADANATGPRAPCVPGAVAGLCLARERFGSLPLERLLAPAIALAEEGVPVDEYLTLQALAQADRLSPDAARLFLPGGRPPVAPFATAAEPPRIRQPGLARTLRAIAADGAGAFYGGELAEEIERAFAEAGGLITREDLAAYRATVERPLSRGYRGTTVLAPRAPSGGSAVLHALGLLDRLEPAEHGSAEDLCQTAEALKSALAERHRDGDAGHGTTHFCAVDREGRLASATMTAGLSFGSGFLAAGALFDSGMAWFDPVPGGPNSIAPRKRPLVNMAPALVVGPTRLAVGAAGGRRIPSAVVQVVRAAVDAGLAPQQAVSAPRLDAGEDPLRLSDRLPPRVAERLRELGHRVLVVPEQHRPFSYEFARPAAVAVAPDGTRTGGIHPFATGFVAGR